jgi:hypothetical protein
MPFSNDKMLTDPTSLEGLQISYLALGAICNLLLGLEDQPAQLICDIKGNMQLMRCVMLWNLISNYLEEYFSTALGLTWLPKKGTSKSKGCGEVTVIANRTLVEQHAH